ncbi:uncharacterized protein IL334_003118 [Kwoniella shivajii]|uniref:BZIP domain-containing protein n=1 Tax=Kwoniella shivajii TaxID=564305 RepID=A0ABZ1CX00_9TREE|nr:hypothetical protein IL334_003118 [Kwoniella shivajii]
MSINTEEHSSLATLLYPPGVDGRPSDENDNHHGLMEYLQNDFPHTETNNAGHQNAGRTDHNSLPPLPGNNLISDKSNTSSSGRIPSQPITSQGQFTSSFQQQGETQVNNQRSPSPPNPSIPIPNSLAKLANQTISSLSLPDPSILYGQEAVERAALLAHVGDRGEMGGKRRKAPHERAGWKEMDSQPNGAKRRRGRKSDMASSNNNIDHTIVEDLSNLSNPSNTLLGHQEQQSQLLQEQRQQTQTQPQPQQQIQQKNDGRDIYENDLRHLTQLSQNLLRQDPTEKVPTIDPQSQFPLQTNQGEPATDNNDSKYLDPALAPTQREITPTQPQPSDAQNPNSPGGDSKLSRAEQNKRAQQAFRRRREEHMKKLESDSVQLGLVKRQMEQKDAMLRDLVLALESSKIEIAALRSSLQFVIPHSSVYPLTEQGTLNLGEEITISNERPATEDELLNAFDLLERQAREVAKQNRSRDN